VVQQDGLFDRRGAAVVQVRALSRTPHKGGVRQEESELLP